MPATSAEVPATQTKWSCPVGSEMATRVNSFYGINFGSWASDHPSGIATIDKDAFQVDGEIYHYDRPKVDTTHVCVKQGQTATD